MQYVYHRISLNLVLIAVIVIGVSSSCLSLFAADWPTYRADANRSGYTADELPTELVQHWKHQTEHAPQPAWPRSTRLTYDRANHCVIAKGRVFHGDSVTGKVRALDLKTGQQIWEFYTEGPVRFAPAVWQDQLFVASDDGHLYALQVDNGTLLWKRRGGPGDKMVVGNERVISKWPARGAPVVWGNTVYFASGIWPSDGIFLYALNAKTGEQIWSNKDSGQIYMPQPHGGANANSGISAQGYLAVAGDHLLVPAGRAVPASMDRHTGKFEYFHLQKNRKEGGGDTIVIGDLFLNSGVIFKSADGQAIGKSGGGQIAATKDGLVLANKGTITRYQWIDSENPDRKGKLVQTKSLKKLWSAKAAHTCDSIIIAGNKIVSGSAGFVDLIDLNSGKNLWTTSVEGTAYGLAVSNGNLVVSTDRGMIYAFGSPNSIPPGQQEKTAHKTPFPSNSKIANVAAEILSESKVDHGYCFDIGCGDGALAYEIATRTKMRVVAIESDPQLVAMARKNLTAAGLYGKRVVVLQRPLDQTNCPNKVANLIVSSRSIKAGTKSLSLTEARRLQRPYGGVICYGKPGELKTELRGAIPGAGEWTHQYADAGNSLCSNDKLVNGQLGMLWYRDFDFVVPSRHGRGPAPLFSNGRLFHEGNDGIIAVDAFNGHELWQFKIEGVLKAYDGDELMGASGTGSNYCLGDNFVFVRHEQKCFQVDAATGQLVKTFEVPPPKDASSKEEVKQPWGYIAFHDGAIIGSAADPSHIVAYRYHHTTGDMKKQLTESNRLFAFDVKTGRLKWQHDSKDSFRHNAIAIADDKIYLIDRPLAEFDRTKESKRKPLPKTRNHPTGQLICLSITDGYVLWKNGKDIYGTMLAVSPENNALLMSYQPTSFRLSSEIGGRLSVFDSNTGEKTWEAKANYKSRPLINGKTVYAQGGAWDLLSGKPKPFNFKRSYGCGILASCENMMFFRSATLGYFDFNKNTKIENYGGVRPGCWINAIPAGGLVLVPDASAACSCSYLNKSWFALETVTTN
ncbi:outer membrane protein assembly factor BamB family protein [Gimesia aquarii]|uniref:Outer membrane biogenesis protein BamB n=1 Tax=Gimesia aquarii TaxID=2527964 RepID=A0A517VXT0_9PLAN|nr:PQQ-binding-like beta-propeller repeat protein [Gimesia aquarii]QDT97809.1 outer membrane biogenesis protein BamB [Gimesia aquarii]